MFDISSFQYKSQRGSKFGLFFADKHTRYKKIYFLSSKSQITNKGLEYIHFMETQNINMATFRLNNAGEHIEFNKNWCKSRNTYHHRQAGVSPKLIK